MSYQNDMRNMLNIQNENIHYDNSGTEMTSVKERPALVIHATLTYTPHVCEQCGVKNKNYSVYKNGTQTSLVKLPLNIRQPTYLKLRKQRFRCKECHGSLVAKTDIVEENCFIANVVKSGVVVELTRAISIKDIVERLYITWHTFSRCIRGAAKDARPYHQTLPPHLSFDEFKYRKGRMAFDYCNAETGEFLGIIPGLHQRYLTKSQKTLKVGLNHH